MERGIPGTAGPARPGHRLEIKSIEREGKNTARISGMLEMNPPPEDIVGVRVSRRLPSTPDTGLPWPGHWSEATDGVIAVNGQWSITRDAFPGENLYRVQVDGHPGLEDVAGYYAVPAGEGLATGEDHQRKQALVFRDAVREVLADPLNNYGDTYPEQLIVAIGAQEKGGSTPEYPYGFSNDGNGIMQVTCGSSYRGATAGVICPNNYSYDMTAQGIEFNVKDAMLALNGAFGFIQGPMPDRCLTIKDANNKTDELITAVVYYNAWCNFDEKYKGDGDGPEPEGPQYIQRYYLREVAGHLENSPGNNLPNHLSIAEFMADADYTDDDLKLALEDGQSQICALPGVNCD